MEVAKSGHGAVYHHIVLNERRMNADIYGETLNKKFLTPVKMKLRWTFQWENDPKHTAKATKERCENRKINIWK